MATITRRNFLKSATVTVGTVAAAGTVQGMLNRPPAVHADVEHLITSANDTIVPTVCLLCPSGCGMLARVADGRVVKMEGSPMHPINLGALCPKGQAAPELLYNPDRLTGPLRRTGERGADQWEPITWDEAIQTVAQRLTGLRDAGTPEQSALMFGDTRGQLRSFLDRFMQAVGSPNVISKESQNVGAAQLANYLTQGVYDFPIYDLENTNYVLSFGANLLEGGPTVQRTISGYTYLRRGRSTRGKVVVFDPRQGIFGSKADEWIPIVPGTDAVVALSMANVLIRAGLVDEDFVHNYAFGFDDFTDSDGTTHKGFKNFVLENYDPRRAEQITGVSATTISRLAGEFASNQPGVAILPGKGGMLNGSMGGVYAAMAVHMLNGLVGNLEKPGGVLTQRYLPCVDWPALAADAVAEQGLQAERVDGAGTAFPLARHAYQAVADRVLAGAALDTLFLYDANPVFDAPGGQRFVEAFKQIPFIVSFASFMDETARYADLVLPEPTFLERWQDDHMAGLGYPGIGLRQPVIEPIHDTMNVGDFFLKTAQAMGGSVAAAFPWATYEEVLQFRLQEIGTDWETFKELGVWLWPGYRYARRGSTHWVNEVVGRDRRNTPRDGRFDFYAREINCVLGGMGQEELAALGISMPGDAVNLPHYEATPFQGEEATYPLLLNVVTLMSLGPMSAAANMPTLMEISGMTVGESWTGWAEISPQTAQRFGVEDGEMVWITSLSGQVRTKLHVMPGMRADVLTMPYNFGHTAGGRWAKNRGVNGLDLLAGQSEPVSGLAAMTNTRVTIQRG